MKRARFLRPSWIIFVSGAALIAGAMHVHQSLCPLPLVMFPLGIVLLGAGLVGIVLS